MSRADTWPSDESKPTMADADLVAFLQWALPRLGLRWPGYRKVRGTVRKRLNHRLRELNLSDLGDYRCHLEAHPAEWGALREICLITISRFYRDRAVFDRLRRVVLPELARLARGRSESELRCWSAGCASGEEPYTLKILWELGISEGRTHVPLRIVATDADEAVLARARAACYGLGSLKDLPLELRDRAFTRQGDQLRVRDELRQGIEFRQEDLTAQMPAGPFHLILCRNLAFTYFDEPLQHEILGRMAGRLVDGGYLVVGAHEALPGCRSDLVKCTKQGCFHRRIAGDPAADSMGSEREMLLPTSSSRPVPGAIRGDPKDERRDREDGAEAPDPQVEGQ
jgi:chemotaxis protein methyltransferase CheR